LYSSDIRINLVPARGKKALLISSPERVFSLANNPDMLSPTLSAPSASLLRFLRSQTGGSVTTSVCAYPKRLAGRGKAFSTESPKLTGWTRSETPHNSATFDTGLCASTRGRPVVKATLSPPSVPVQLTSSRHASTKNRPFLRRLFDLKRNKAADYQSQTPPGSGFMDEGTEGMFNIGRSLSAKASNELRIRCTEFDTNGDVTLVNGEFRKQELIAKVRLENTEPEIQHALMDNVL
jgi:magnesium transporter